MKISFHYFRLAFFVSEFTYCLGSSQPVLCQPQKQRAENGRMNAQTPLTESAKGVCGLRTTWHGDPGARRPTGDRSAQQKDDPFQTSLLFSYCK